MQAHAPPTPPPRREKNGSAIAAVSPVVVDNGDRGKESPIPLEYPQDMHGFVLKGSTEFVSSYAGWHRAYTKKQSERVVKWTDVIKRSPSAGYVKNAALKKLVRKGVPNCLRGKVWMDISGATQKMEANKGLYKELLDSASEGSNPDALAQIELDLHRTFPDHPRFNLGRARGSPGSPEKTAETPHVERLRRVLRAYSCRNSLVGYCQGMNFIAGIMLLYLEEESVFWLMAMLLETILPPDYYASDLIGCNVDLRVFGELLVQKLPKVAKKFDACSIGVEFFSLEWFISLFSKAFPSETVLRIWDCMFFEGDKILFRVALGVVSMSEAEILAAPDQNDLLQVVQDLGRRELDADALLKAAFAFQMKRDAIHTARDRFRAEVEQERQSRAQRVTPAPVRPATKPITDSA